jgi:hypothetical protein
MRLRTLAAGVALALAFVAGCGGSANKPASSEVASFVPDKVVGFVSVDTDVESPQWKNAQALLDRFPIKSDLLAQIRKSLSEQGLDWNSDIKPALGKELGVAVLDFSSGSDVVGITKPQDEAKFDALLEKGTTPLVHEKIDGWTVFAERQRQLDRFEQLKNDSGSLADDEDFKHAMEGLPGDALATTFLRGNDLQSRLDRSIEASGGPANAVETYVGTIASLALATTAQSDGVRFDAAASGDFKANPPTYHAELPSALPAGAVAYLSFDRLDRPLATLLANGNKLSPNFEQQRAQIEALLGYSLDKDVLPLLAGEGALAVYPTTSGPPEVLLAIKIADEAKAQRVLDRIQTLAQLSGRVKVNAVKIGQVSGIELVIPNSTTSVFVALFDGRLVVSNLRSGIEDMQGAGPRLADDSAYKNAVSAAGMPNETAGFFYTDLRGGLDYVFAYLEGKGQTIPKVVRENTAPLRGLLLYLTKDGDRFTFSGFLGIQ